MKTNKRRALRATTHPISDVTEPIVDQVPEALPKDHPMVLQYQLAYVKYAFAAASDRKARLEDLMQRRSAKKWDAGKKAKMVRRLVNSTNMVEQCVGAIDELTTKLQTLAAQAPQPANVAPFIKAPPTSVESEGGWQQQQLEAPTPLPEPTNLDTPFGT
jgi:hypothetical protein